MATGLLGGSNKEEHEFVTVRGAGWQDMEHVAQPAWQVAMQTTKPAIWICMGRTPRSHDRFWDTTEEYAAEYHGQESLRVSNSLGCSAAGTNRTADRPVQLHNRRRPGRVISKRRNEGMRHMTGQRPAVYTYH
jgi:hypothetical protein